MDMVQAQGRDALVALAARFPQLYVAPAEDALDAHRLAAGRGIAPAEATLDHFVTSPDDELRIVETPAGPVEVVFLRERSDFETFLQIVGYKAQPVPIARTVGAITYRGLADWGKVAQAHRECVAAGGDWSQEFARLARQPGAFRAELIVISEGPYSNIAAADTLYDEAAWIRASREIRLHHECAHVVCRRLLPEDIAPVWDEVTADVVGLLCATEGYDAHLAAQFLGTSADGFVGGRLVEYLNDEQKQRIDELAREVHASLARIEARVDKDAIEHPFDFLLDLKQEPYIAY